MQHRMFYPADIHIHRKVFIRLFPAYQFLIVFAVHIPKEIPGWPCPLGHGVCLPLCSFPAFGAGGIYPVFNIRQRRFPGSCGLIGIHIRQKQWEFFFRHRHSATVFAVDNGNWLSPVTLAGKYPVSELIVCRLFPKSSFFYHSRGFPL